MVLVNTVISIIELMRANLKHVNHLLALKHKRFSQMEHVKIVLLTPGDLKQMFIAELMKLAQVEI